MSSHAVAENVSFLKPDRNCWKISPAKRLRILIDADEYYKTFAKALRNAKETVMIVAWDIDTRVTLDPDIKPKGLTLEAALRDALDSNPRLKVFILCWNFAMIYTLERQLFPQFKRIFQHPRIHLVLDDRHPFGGSHHQKIIIVDDQMAFIGGLDICAHRWDTPRHDPNDIRRIDHSGKTYAPFHDIQVALDGDVVKHFAQIARKRWEMATNVSLPWSQTENSPWPKSVEPHFQNVSVAISRTHWGSAGVEPVREILNLYLDSIRMAKRYVYIENQYFTSDHVCEALLDRLKDHDCPEFLVVLPKVNVGWLEQSTMGQLRLRLIKRLQEADRFKKFRVYYPEITHPKRSHVSVHSKLMIADDEILHTGSSNLSNRSMGLDTEADIAFEAQGDAQISAKIAEIRSRLIAEHLGVPWQSVDEIVRRTGSLFLALDQLIDGRRSRRTLRRFRGTMSRTLDALLPEATILDPERPFDEDPAFQRYVPKDPKQFCRKSFRRLRFRLLFAGLASIALSPYRKNIESLVVRAQYTPSPLRRELLWSLVAFSGGLSARIATESVIFVVGLPVGSRRSINLSLFGLASTALIYYGLGVWTQMPRPRPHRKPGEGKANFWTYFLLNANASLLAPYVDVAFEAGKVKAPLVHFVAGTVCGQSFRLLATNVYLASTKQLIRRPGLGSVAITGLAAAAILTLFRWSSRRLLPMYRHSC